MSDTETPAPPADPAPSQKVKFKVNQLIDAEQLKADLTYSLADLSAAMVSQAATFVHYGMLHAKAQRQVSTFELTLENMEAKVYRQLRDEAAISGAKVTEASLEKAVAVNDTIVALKKALNEAQQVEAMAKIAVEGFKQRKDMLVSQGMISREEMRGEVIIHGRQEREDDMAAQRNRLLDTMHKIATPN